MKKVVIDTALLQSRIGHVVFAIDPELVRNKRTEPEGCYPSSGTVDIFLEPSCMNVVGVIKYDGETHRTTKPATRSDMNDFSAYASGAR